MMIDIIICNGKILTSSRTSYCLDLALIKAMRFLSSLVTNFFDTYGFETDFLLVKLGGLIGDCISLIPLCLDLTPWSSSFIIETSGLS